MPEGCLTTYCILKISCLVKRSATPGEMALGGGGGGGGGLGWSMNFQQTSESPVLGDTTKITSSL